MRTLDDEGDDAASGNAVCGGHHVQPRAHVDNPSNGGTREHSSTALPAATSIVVVDGTSTGTAGTSTAAAGTSTVAAQTSTVAAGTSTAAAGTSNAAAGTTNAAADGTPTLAADGTQTLAASGMSTTASKKTGVTSTRIQVSKVGKVISFPSPFFSFSKMS